MPTIFYTRVPVRSSSRWVAISTQLVVQNERSGDRDVTRSISMFPQWPNVNFVDCCSRKLNKSIYRVPFVKEVLAQLLGWGKN